VGAVLFLTPSLAPQQTVSVDALSYHQIAANLVENQIFTSSVDPPYNDQKASTFRPPLTPFYLALIYKVVGINLLWGRLGLALLSAFSCGLSAWLGEKLFGRATGILAGSISCVYPFFLLLVMLPLTEGLSIFLSLLLMVMFYAYEPQQRNADTSHHFQDHLLKIISMGVVFGLTLLNKAANIVLLPCLVFWSVFRMPGSRITRFVRVGVVIIIAAGMILPWAMRNQAIVGAFTPVNSNGGWTFYLGNNEHTEKNLRALEEGTTNGWIPPKEVFVPFSDLSFEDTKNYEERAIQLGLTFIREHPGTFVNFALRKLKIFWSPYHHIVDKMSWYPLLVFSVIGLGYSLKCWKKNMLVYLLILTSMSIPAFFTSMPRFRAPIIPFMIIYGAFGFIKIAQIVKQSSRDHADRY
jgi:4-amino-4-deoxy-L-arabinose transferase-like glycosyltransferase